MLNYLSIHGIFEAKPYNLQLWLIVFRTKVANDLRTPRVWSALDMVGPWGKFAIRVHRKSAPGGLKGICMSDAPHTLGVMASQP